MAEGRRCDERRAGCGPCGNGSAQRARWFRHAGDPELSSRGRRGPGPSPRQKVPSSQLGGSLHNRMLKAGAAALRLRSGQAESSPGGRGGYAATTIDAIAADAGVAVPTVYATMKTKQAILWVPIEVTARGDAGEIPLAAAGTCSWKLERARPLICGWRADAACRRTAHDDLAGPGAAGIPRFSPLRLTSPAGDRAMRADHFETTRDRAAPRPARSRPCRCAMASAGRSTPWAPSAWSVPQPPDSAAAGRRVMRGNIPNPSVGAE
jgi:Bacterial regulatory proteins, tetR family